jgi:hypothetical protein
MPAGAGLNATGSFYSRTLDALSYPMVANVTPVTLTNPTTATDLMTFTFPLNPSGNGSMLNGIGHGFVMLAAGNYNLAASSTLVFTIKLGTVTIASFTTASQTNTSVTLNWQLELTTISVGLGSSGTVEAHGKLFMDSGATLPAAASVFLDSVTAVSSAIDLTQPLLLEVMANLGTGNSSSTVSQRMLQLVVLQ